MKTLALLIAGVSICSILPIWRGAGHSRHDGVSFWGLLYDSTRGVPGTNFGHPHVSYAEALLRAHLAWEGANVG